MDRTDRTITGLVIAATPLGRAEDASAHLCRLLVQADVIAAEDTRKLLDLARRLKVQPGGRIVSLHDHNERSRVEQLLAAARSGLVVLVSDAGTPLVSDPGFVLTRAAIDAGLDVGVAPGPSAVTTALLLSGLPAERFVFEGFLPRSKGRRGRLEELATERRTIVLFESPRRLGQTLAELRDHLGPDRPGAVCREMTKVHQEVRRGSLAELADWASHGVLGEVTVVVAGAQTSQARGTQAQGPQAVVADLNLEGGQEVETPDVPQAVVVAVEARVEAGDSLKDAAAAEAAAHGYSRRAVYQAVLAARHQT
ncbi:MAG: 16S rRNA (cytidine(1402)-2'-O)-methyltransferase [Micrococcales bacterium]|nr:16S rRNA (cytidine(1402)-2'-O)-methyltransferase [Micrococcales bacterium]